MRKEIDLEIAKSSLGTAKVISFRVRPKGERVSATPLIMCAADKGIYTASGGRSVANEIRRQVCGKCPQRGDCACEPWEVFESGQDDGGGLKDRHGNLVEVSDLPDGCLLLAGQRIRLEVLDLELWSW